MDELIGLKLKDIADGRVTKGFIFEKIDGTLIGFRVPKDKIEEVDFENKSKEDNWNLADESNINRPQYNKIYANEQIKTFIQKVKEDSESIWNYGIAIDGNKKEAVTKYNKIIDKRAGDL